MTDDTDEYGIAARERHSGLGSHNERKLAGLWADVLGVPAERIQRTDNFFEIGGTSRAAARLVIALDQGLSLGEFARCSTLGDLAALLDERQGARPVPALG
ncbi:phosphopantetheine-binding protein [Streptomyces sp. NPDC089799]|uniref:acyl carrier protein n=1 Tax=Streptomyces sp. NPDC089799 TaxID=3155066 RepID=UPI00342A9D6A